MQQALEWHKVADVDDLEDGRVRTVVAGDRSIALTRVGDRYGALDNHCPHQGGPLGEGSIEKGLLRCPWHGYDYDPLTGTPPSGFSDAPACFPLEVREDGVYVGVEPTPAHVRTVSDVMVETMVAWGVTHVFGMVGHSNLGFADAMRRQEEAGHLTFIGIRHEGAAAFAASAYGKLTGRPAACFGIAGPGIDEPPHRPLRRQGRPLPGARDLGPGAVQGARPGRVPGRRSLRCVRRRRQRGRRRCCRDSDHAELMTLALKHARVERNVAHLVLPDEVQEQEVGPEPRASGPSGRIGDDEVTPPVGAIEDACALLGRARRPVVVLGHGARFEMEDVTAFAEALDAPVITTFKAKGLVSDRHPLGGGVLGRSGTPVASWLMNESDLLVVFGASFSNHTGIAPVQADHPGRLRPDGARALPSGDGPRARPRRRDRPPPARARARQPGSRRSARRCR